MTTPPEKPTAKDAPWTVGRVMAWTREEFQKRKLDSPRLDAEILLGQALGLTRVQLYMDWEKPLKPEELTAFKNMVRRRAAREPVSLIIGEREFYGRPFKVTRDTLTPRPDTETLVEDVVRRHRGREGLRILDVGTGTGCIAITLALELPGSTVTAVDISAGALEVARENSARLGANVELLLSDMDGALAAAARFDVVVSNPPYLTEAEWKEAPPEVRDYEPRTALVGDDVDGLGHHRALAGKLWPRVLSGGGLWAELGWKQGPAAVTLWKDLAGAADVTLLQDLEKRDRVVRVTRS
ncbi:MAG: peptide chain release factor N(5)-glutamine methyltransferase [Myxococcota bacterium]